MRMKQISITVMLVVTGLAVMSCSAAPPTTTEPSEAPTATDIPAPTETPIPTNTPAPTSSPTPSTAPGYEEAQQFEGDWTGSWHNTTYGSTGSADMTVIVNDDGTFDITVDLGGQVFGIGDPPPIPFSGSYSDNDGEVSVLDDPTMGSLSFEIDDEGQLSGGSDNLLLSTGTIDITGTITPEQIDLHYALALPSGVQAEGDVTMTPVE